MFERADYHARTIAEIAAARRVPWLVIPPDLADLSVALDAALEGHGERARSNGAASRRHVHHAGWRAPAARRRRRRWMVYDRRSSGPSQRVFVGSNGRSMIFAIAGSMTRKRTPTPRRFNDSWRARSRG